MRLPFVCHASAWFAKPLPRLCLAFQCGCHAFAMRSPRICLAFTMHLLCVCHANVMHLPRVCPALDMHLPSLCHVLPMCLPHFCHVDHAGIDSAPGVVPGAVEPSVTSGICDAYVRCMTWGLPVLCQGSEFACQCGSLFFSSFFVGDRRWDTR